MRTRQPADWTRDLQNRHALETTVATALRHHAAVRVLNVSTRSMNELDYSLTLRSHITIAVELKEKRQTYSPWWNDQWEHQYPEHPRPPLFIVDELAVRKLAAKGPHAYLLINDSTCIDRWYACSIGDVLFGDFVRVSRPLHNNIVKGKLLLNLDTMPVAEEHLVDAIDGIDLLSRTVSACWADVKPWPVLRVASAA
jgi:hypothetical protein